MVFPHQDEISADYLWPDYRAQDSYRAIWLEVGRRQTVLLGVAKGLGQTYYGIGLTCDTDKGYHSEPYEPRLYFIDVNMLGRVVRGKLAPFDVRAYEMVSPYEVWRHPEKPGNDPTCKREWFADLAYDAEGQRLFATQVNAYHTGSSARPVVHVWSVH